MITKFKGRFSVWLSDRSRWAWSILFGIVLPLAIAFGLAMGCYTLYGVAMGEIPADQREVPFKDVLLTVLAISAIAIATFGAGAYKILSASIEERERRRTDKALSQSTVTQKIDSGWLYWNLYQMSAGKPLPTRSYYLEQAILETAQACSWILEHLNEKERQIERLLVIARNNWAFYIYEQDLARTKICKADKATALECVEYLEQRIARFPELTAEVVDTIEKVASHFWTATL